jgi:hypothetical protein
MIDMKMRQGWFGGVDEIGQVLVDIVSDRGQYLRQG